MFSRIKILLFSIIICFAMTSYAEAESWACSDPNTTFVIKRMGNKFKVMTGKEGSNIFDIVSENFNNLVLLRNLNENYLVMIINKQTYKFSYVVLDATTFLGQQYIGMGVTSAISGKCETY